MTKSEYVPLILDEETIAYALADDGVEWDTAVKFAKAAAEKVQWQSVYVVLQDEDDSGGK